MNRLPSWFKQEIPERIVFSRLRLLSEFKLRTVCQEARCPNLSRCFKNSRLAFIILGENCTRNCRFCAVKKSHAQPLALDLDEPRRIAQAVKELGLNYVVITSVTRDDLPDSGAELFARSLELIHNFNQGIKVEVLIPDFSGNVSSLKTVIDARPCVMAHNLETVQRLYKEIRPQANYEVSLELLRKIRKLKPGLTTKSALMLGLGETEAEVFDAMADLRRVDCDILTLGQYLAPSAEHYPVKEFIHPQQFQNYYRMGVGLGFKLVLCGPLVRSSYQAQEVYHEVANV